MKHKKLSQKNIRIKDQISGYDKKIIIKTFRLPNGVIENFFIDAGKDSVQIFPMTTCGNVVVVEQFRPGLEIDNVELPGGAIDENESPEHAAERELLEETGYKGKIHYLGCVPYSPYSTGERHLFVASECNRISKMDLDENEFLKVKLVPLCDFVSLMKIGKVRGHDVAYMGLHKLNMLDVLI